MFQHSGRRQAKPFIRLGFQDHISDVRRVTPLKNGVLIRTETGSGTGDRLWGFSIQDKDIRKYLNYGSERTHGEAPTIIGVGSYQQELYVGFIEGGLHFISKIKMIEEGEKILFGAPEVKKYTLDIENKVKKLCVTPDGEIWLLAGVSLFTYSWKNNLVQRREVCNLFAPKDMWFLEPMNLWVVSDPEKNVLEMYHSNWVLEYSISPKYGHSISSVTSLGSAHICITEIGQRCVYLHELGDRRREKDRVLLEPDFFPEGLVFSGETKALIVYCSDTICGFQMRN